MALRLAGQVTRRIEAVLRDLLRDEPVVAIQGARAVGKSTLLRSIATGMGTDVLDLDDLGTRDAVARDPALFMGGPSPVCVDEYQHVPELLDAIKAELNRDSRPGRFIITGSTRHDALPLAAQALTGRLHVSTVRPLSQVELAESRINLIASLRADPDSAAKTTTQSQTDRTAYVERVVAGGFPMALARSGAARARWLDDYIDSTVQRDLRELARIRQPVSLAVLLTRLAGQTAQVLNITNAARAAGLEERTANGYVRLLEALFLLHRLPAWGRTLSSRSAAMPKVHLVDSGVAARLLRLSPEKLARLTPSALTEFGHLLETFVVGELLTQASWLDDIAGVGHWRTHSGLEVDLVIECRDGRILAFEVKAAGRVTGRELNGLRALRDLVGDDFVTGVALYTGTRSYTAEDRLHVLPIDRLWT